MLDLPEYIKAFNVLIRGSIEDASYVIKSEYGWLIFNKLLTYISDSYMILLIIHSSIVIYAYFKTIKDFSIIPWLSVFLFVTGPFNQSIYVMRQHMAMALCLFTIPYILNRNFWKFMLIVILASSIHYTAIIFLPTYFIYSLRIDKKFWILFGSIFLLLFNFFQIMMNYIMLDLNLGYSSYIDSAGTNYTAFLISTCVFILVFLSIKVKQLKGHEKFIFQLFVIGYVISAAGIGNPVTSRLNMYYGISSILLIPMAIKRLQTPVKYFVLIPMMIFYYYMWVSHDIEGYKFLLW